VIYLGFDRLGRYWFGTSTRTGTRNGTRA